MARLTLPPDTEMTSEQIAVCQEVVAGQRGKVPSPMIAWLRNPELARRGQMLGEVLRFNTTLDTRLTELAILVCARHWTSHQVWTSHKKHALAAGLAPDTVADIATRRHPALTDMRAEAVFKTSSALLARHRLEDDEYREAVAILGETGVVEVVSLVGYYCLVALTANAFELGLPENTAAELGPVET